MPPLDNHTSGELLSPRAARQALQVCRNTLAAMRQDGRIEAVNINPAGKRAVWRYRLGTLTAARRDRQGILTAATSPEEILAWERTKKRLGL